MRILRTEYEVVSNRPVVYVFCREENKHHVNKDTSLVHYFYVMESEKNKIRGVKCDSRTYVATDGTKLSKVYVSVPSDVPGLREQYSKSWEADIVFPVRYLIDKVDVLEPCNPKVMFLDIETDNSGRVPDPKLAPEQVLCATIFTGDVYTTFIHRADFSPGKESRVFFECLDEIVYHRNEEEMLRALARFSADEGADVGARGAAAAACRAHP